MIQNETALDEFLLTRRQEIIRQTKMKLEEKGFMAGTVGGLLKSKVDENPNASVQDIMDQVFPTLMEKVPKDIKAYVISEIKK